jgi:glucose-6-phosphate isomerase/transaldolase/glucose-6-phosphate isomerase
VEDVLLLGMGGSSLAPEVFRRTLGSAPGRPRLHVLDTTSPRRIRRVTEAIDARRFHALVASKSGSTIEVRTLFAHYRAVAAGVGEPGARFTAITDPGTGLEELARAEGFRACFTNDPDIGGRYSALSCFGLVPAAVLGADVDGLLDRAAGMAAACLDDGPAASNPGCVLGAALGAAAGAGRDKLTLLLSPEIESLGLWVEQLVAESTGKDGRGIVPVVGEPWVGAGALGNDRLFVASRVAGGRNEGLDARVAELQAAGCPVLTIDLDGPLDLGAAMFRWEHATAVAGHVLGIQPFDQPDVQSTKAATMRILDALRRGESLPDEAGGDGGRLLRAARPGDYVALMVYGDPSSELLDALDELRAAVGRSLRLATTLGIGPRFLHSTGQLHKGGAANGVFLQILLDEEDVPVPGEHFGFRELLGAQAGGDLDALRAAGRRVARLDGDPVRAVRELTEGLSGR